MSRPFILVGDRIDHGGVVVAGTPATCVNGRAVARLGDPVVCEKHGLTTIATGDATLTIDGKPVARDRDKTACGATLISSQSMTYVDPDDRSPNVELRNNKLPLVGPPDQSGSRSSTSNSKGAFNRYFILKNNQTGRPLPGVKYRIRLEDGSEVTGTSDANGATQKIAADYALKATVKVYV